MSDNKPQLGAGDVPIMLDGQQLMLRPTLRAAQLISRQSDGIRGAMNRVLQLDLDTVVNVIALGLGYSAGGPEMKALPDKVWRTGLTDDTGALAERCITFLRVLSGGGRPPPEGEAHDDNPNPQPQS